MALKRVVASNKKVCKVLLEIIPLLHNLKYAASSQFHWWHLSNEVDSVDVDGINPDISMWIQFKRFIISPTLNIIFQWVD